MIASSIFVAPDSHRAREDHARERDHRDFGGAAANIDDHVASRLRDRKARANRRFLPGFTILSKARLVDG